MNYQLWLRYTKNPATKKSLYRNHQWLRVIERIAQQAAAPLGSGDADDPKVKLLMRALRRPEREDARKMRAIMNRART